MGQCGEKWISATLSRMRIVWELSTGKKCLKFLCSEVGREVA